MAGIRITNAVQHLYNKLRAMPGATGSGVAAKKGATITRVTTTRVMTIQ